MNSLIIRDKKIRVPLLAIDDKYEIAINGKVLLVVNAAMERWIVSRAFCVKDEDAIYRALRAYNKKHLAPDVQDAVAKKFYEDHPTTKLSYMPPVDSTATFGTEEKGYELALCGGYTTLSLKHEKEALKVAVTTRRNVMTAMYDWFYKYDKKYGLHVTSKGDAAVATIDSGYAADEFMYQHGLNNTYVTQRHDTRWYATIIGKCLASMLFTAPLMGVTQFACGAFEMQPLSAWILFVLVLLGRLCTLHLAIFTIKKNIILCGHRQLRILSHYSLLGCLVQ